MKVLLLTAATGGGHTKAAGALAECLSAKHPEWETVTVDTLKYISRFLDKVIIGTYLGTVKKAPNLYGRLYKRSEKNSNLTDLSMAFNKLLSYRLCRFIDEYKPSVIICTHTFPLQMLSNLKRRGRINIPVIGIVTDFVSHLFWKLDGIDALIVSHGQIKKDMMKLGIPGGIIYTFGIPVSTAFREKPDRQLLLHELGLQDKLTLLIMGGSLGLGEVKSIFSSMLNCKRDIQLIAVTGQNEKLKCQLEELSRYSDKSVKILGYSHDIHKLMNVSDLIVTKPGGVTVSEALVKRLPILIIQPIPGQEERNADFLERMGAAIRLPNDENLESALYSLLDDPIKLKSMRDMSGVLARPDAGEDILRLIEDLTHDQYLLGKDRKRFLLAESL